MKSNLVIVQPPHVRWDSVIEQWCESFCESHYVYLVRPNSKFREDSPAGVRFLGHSLDRLPAFGSVDTAIAVADPAVAERLKECYPQSNIAVWDPGADGGLPDSISSLFKPSVVRWDFGQPQKRNFARAM
ncbi:MAG TPA: hypothetical protein VF258_09200 [Luteolibacter sp.]